jgi:hypothetical protein
MQFLGCKDNTFVADISNLNFENEQIVVFFDDSAIFAKIVLQNEQPHVLKNIFYLYRFCCLLQAAIIKV